MTKMVMIAEVEVVDIMVEVTEAMEIEVTEIEEEEETTTMTIGVERALEVDVVMEAEVVGITMPVVEVVGTKDHHTMTKLNLRKDSMINSLDHLAATKFATMIFHLLKSLKIIA